MNKLRRDKIASIIRQFQTFKEGYDSLAVPECLDDLASIRNNEGNKKAIKHLTEAERIIDIFIAESDQLSSMLGGLLEELNDAKNVK
jgi:hypothetical protein